MKREDLIDRFGAGSVNHPWRRLAGCVAIGSTLTLAQPAEGLEIELIFHNIRSVIPSYDPNAQGLQRLFQYAASHYEERFPTLGDLKINFWYEVMDSNNGATFQVRSPGPTREADIRIRSNRSDWFIDPTPWNDSEFNMRQTLWRDLSSSTQEARYNFTSSTDIPSTFEVSYTGRAVSGGPADGRKDMLSVILHEFGHALGVTGRTDLARAETGDGDYDFTPAFVFGQDLAAEVLSSNNTAHLDLRSSLMYRSVGEDQRRRPSHTDLFAMASGSGVVRVNVPRKEYYGDGNWSDNYRWSGNRQPTAADEVFIRDDHTVVVSSDQQAHRLHVAESAIVFISTPAVLDVSSQVTVTGSGTSLHIFGVDSEFDASAGLTVEDQAEIRMTSGKLIFGTFDLKESATLVSTSFSGPGTSEVQARFRFHNAGTIRAEGDSHLILKAFFNNGIDPWDLDGPNGTGRIEATGGDITIESGTFDGPFEGTMEVGPGHFLRINEPWTNNGTLMLNGGNSVSDSATLSGGDIATGSGSDINVSGHARVETPLTVNGSLTANQANVLVTDSLWVGWTTQGGSETGQLAMTDSHLEVERFLVVGSGDGAQGTAQFTDSTVTANRRMYVGVGGGQGSVHFQGSTATVSELDIGTQGPGSQGTVEVEAGTLTIQDHLDLGQGATLSVGDGGRVVVNTGLSVPSGATVEVAGGELNLAAEVSFITHEATWSALVDRVEVFDTTSANVLLANEVTSPPTGNSQLGGVLTFDSANTGLSRSFTVETLQPGAGFTFNDNEGPPLPVILDALSVGDMNDYEDDDFQISITNGPALYGFAFSLNDNVRQAGELLSVYGPGDVLLGTTPVIPGTNGVRAFWGVLSTTPITRIAFDENAGGDDILIADFRFAVPFSGVNVAVPFLGTNVNLPGGQIRVDDGTLTAAGGLVNQGLIRLAGSHMTVDHVLVLDQASTLVMGIGGTGRGDEYAAIDTQQLIITDGATLRVELTDGFTPAYEDVFEIVLVDDSFGLDHIPDEHGFTNYEGDVFWLNHLGLPRLALVPVIDGGLEELEDGEAQAIHLVTTATGDANGDLVVDSEDLNTLALNWQQGGKDWYEADFTGDGFVDAEDLNQLALNWQFGVDTLGTGLASQVSFDDAWADALATVAVPEPSTWGLVSLGALSFLRKNGRSNLLEHLT